MCRLPGLRAFLLLIWFSSLWPLGAAGPEALSVHAVTVDFPLISIRVKLIASGSFDVTTSTFAVNEGGAAITEFAVASATPRQIMAFVLDRSSSLENQIRDVRKSAVAFLKSLPVGLKIEVISFASDIEIDQEFTLARNDLISAVEKLRPWGGTCLYDAVYMACDRLYANSDPRDFRTLILFTDGRDETPVTRQQMSIRNLDEALSFARKKQVRIIAVGMGDQIDQNVLKKLSSETGGWYMYAPKAQALFAVYERIASLMKAEKHFQLAYQSPNQDRNGEKREIRVTVQTPAGPQERQLEYTAPLPLKTKPVSTIGIAMPGDAFGTTPSADASTSAHVSQPTQPTTPADPPKPAFEIKIREGKQSTGLDLPPFPDTPPAAASDTPAPTGQFR